MLKKLIDPIKHPNHIIWDIIKEKCLRWKGNVQYYGGTGFPYPCRSIHTSTWVIRLRGKLLDWVIRLRGKILDEVVLFSLPSPNIYAINSCPSSSIFSSWFCPLQPRLTHHFYNSINLCDYVLSSVFTQFLIFICSPLQLFNSAFCSSIHFAKLIRQTMVLHIFEVMHPSLSYWPGRDVRRGYSTVNFLQLWIPASRWGSSKNAWTIEG